jgi:hypothetical protein
MIAPVSMLTRRDGSIAILQPVPKPRETEARAPVKTTVELPGDLWREAKIRAMDERVDLRTVFIRALEGYLGVAPRPITRRGRGDGR